MRVVFGVLLAVGALAGGPALMAAGLTAVGIVALAGGGAGAVAVIHRA